MTTKNSLSNPFPKVKLPIKVKANLIPQKLWKILYAQKFYSNTGHQITEQVKDHTYSHVHPFNHPKHKFPPGHRFYDD